VQIEQVILKSKTGLTGDVLENALYAIKRSFLGALKVHGLDWVQDNVYICSLSARTIVYKGMVRYTEFVLAHSLEFHVNASQKTLEKSV
jgi:glutamate synthase (ferredoxin)